MKAKQLLELLKNLTEEELELEVVTFSSDEVLVDDSFQVTDKYVTIISDKKYYSDRTVG